MKIFFQKILEFIKNEPAAFGGAISALVQAILGVIVAFNLSITPEQQQAILGLTASLVSITILVAVIVRQNVTPTANPRNDEGKELIVRDEVGG